ncbi:MAG: formyl transferase [Sphingomonas bacterium]|nr:formyl transferase [Sphingomonas bacterium]
MDIWRSGFVRAPLAEVVAAQSLEPFTVQWLPTPSRRFAFLADPFGMTRDGLTHIFVEAFDYRDRRGRIEVLIYDAEMALMDRATCLAEPWHLSYPITIDADGEVYLLPEAHRSGGLTLYRAVEFPRRWEAVLRLDLPHVPIDATSLYHDGQWWLFYSAAGDRASRLHVAVADVLSGPWRPHPASPIALGAHGSRPGGRAVHVADNILLPVQDCSRTYGGAVRPLWIYHLGPEQIEYELGAPIVAPPAFKPFAEGLHTLSACGPITLFDVKRIDRSLAGQATGLVGKVQRAANRSLRPTVGTGPR